MLYGGSLSYAKKKKESLKKFRNLQKINVINAHLKPFRRSLHDKGSIYDLLQKSEVFKDTI